MLQPHSRPFSWQSVIHTAFWDGTNHEARQGSKSGIVQTYRGLPYRLGECVGSPQVARDSSSAALTQGPAPDCSSVSEEGPEGSPGNTPKLAAILAAPAGVGTRTHALGLQRDSQKKHIRGPLLHVTLIRGPGNYSPDHSRGPQADPGEGVGACLLYTSDAADDWLVV